MEKLEKMHNDVMSELHQVTREQIPQIKKQIVNIEFSINEEREERKIIKKKVDDNEENIENIEELIGNIELIMAKNKNDVETAKLTINEISSRVEENTTKNENEHENVKIILQ